jgi:hypothetical protein
VKGKAIIGRVVVPISFLQMRDKHTSYRGNDYNANNQHNLAAVLAVNIGHKGRSRGYKIGRKDVGHFQNF